MSYYRGNVARSRNSWGPMSMSMDFHRLDPDPHYAEECTERMLSAQMRQLDPLKEDLAEWLNKTLGICFLTGENLLSELDNGVILCHLAHVIHDQAVKMVDAGLAKGPPPKIQGKCFERAMRRSFFSRDNMENFIKFCRSLGVHQNLLFESDDLVLHNQPRNVILCLLEVARLAHNKYRIEPPGLVQLEKEIAEEERNNSADSGLGSLLSWQFQATPPRIMTNRMRHSR
ncbi:growth arrest-specific protein 2-like isoform X2 [Agrilus planipennis]|nr:growth arrest-specific protein 2-like isoform X2 [Agrilus planipennis]XP_018331621.1 growth arrest-specific protein 2-like isoform X2 [Agrilus planipennis]XP_018331622.1 growth arrest-specific protein 2-like isoform X2 [Agrilus planipennis]XP_018331623.1 growth arrest-specific protein 2-like isoform X2 [Agrilus planipennis]